MQSTNGIDWYELHDGSGRVSMSSANAGGDGSGQMRIKVAWEHSATLAFYFTGYTEVNGAGQIIAHNPMTHPEFSNLAVARVDREPMGKPTGFNTWEWALLTLQFSTVANTQVDLVEEDLDFSGEVVTVDPDSAGVDVVFEGGTTRPQEALQVPIAYITYTLAFHQMPILPVDLIKTYLNAVNSTPYRIGRQPVRQFASNFDGQDFSFNFDGNIPTLPTNTVEAGRMLMTGATARRKKTTFGSTNWDVSFKFLWSTLFDWREELDRSDYTYKRVTINGDYKYAEADFNQLIALQA